MKLIIITLGLVLISTNISLANSLDSSQELEIYNSLVLARERITHLEKEILVLRKAVLLNEKKNKKRLIALRKEISVLLRDKENWVSEYEKLKRKKARGNLIIFFAGAEGSHLELDVHLGLEFKPLKGLKIYIKGGGRGDFEKKEIEPYYRLGIGYELGLL